MTVTDQIKILDKKNKQNEAQYDLHKKAAIILASSSNDLVDKYEHLTGKDLSLKTSTIEEEKFKYSPLVKVFTKGLNKDGLFKRLKNIKDKNEELLKIKNKTENIKEITNLIKEPSSPEAMALFEIIKTIQKNVNYRKLNIIGDNNVKYDFSGFKTFNDLFKGLLFKNMTIDNAEMKQNEFDAKLNALSRYSPRNQKYIETKNKLLDNAKNFYKGRKKLLKALKKEYFC